MFKSEALTNLFEPALVAALQEYGETKHFAEGAIIIDYGKNIRSMPMILKGTVKVLRKDETGKEILLYYLTSNEICSMAYSCCIESKKSEVKAIAEEAVELVTIPHNKLDEWICTFPSWKNFLLKSFNIRLLELIKTVEGIAFQKLDERLIQYLRDKKNISGSNVVKVSHGLIADDLATSRVVISRLLKQLENDGRILLYRNEIKLLKDF